MLATGITRAMKIAAVRAVADLARVGHGDVVASAHGVADLVSGPDYPIPKPFDPRLWCTWRPQWRRRRCSPVATRPVENFEAYALSCSG
jgi:malate dehydrogenase (oxaloacetate-decarboxylating)(NADP+)